MNRTVRPFVENVAEATTACIVTMVQGNLMALTLSHWLIASQTGVVAGSVTSAAILMARISRPWVVSAILGATTAVVDFFMHPGSFGPLAAEAIVTGLGAALLSYLVQIGVRRWRDARTTAGTESSDRPAAQRRAGTDR